MWINFKETGDNEFLSVDKCVDSVNMSENFLSNEKTVHCGLFFLSFL